MPTVARWPVRLTQLRNSLRETPESFRKQTEQVMLREVSEGAKLKQQLDQPIQALGEHIAKTEASTEASKALGELKGLANR